MASEKQLRDQLRTTAVDLRKLRLRLTQIEDERREPIAIVGMAGRFPGGVSSPAELWDLVAQGRDAIGEFPDNRGWDLGSLYDPEMAQPWTSYVREGGFVHDADRFDAAFFGISPREAMAMDPQQRLLLEASWEAIEDAGIDPASLRGSDTAVFAGIASSDYGIGGDVDDLKGYMATGLSPSILSGRVAYSFGFEGPAMSVDTACSSSLVTLHLACQALRAGECSLALAGGVTILSTPVAFVDLSQQRVLAPDGRSKSFAGAADGAGWSEGAGVLLVERLSDAQRLGHEVLAVVRGSAVNQDGASNGLTAPNGPSQERVIRQALANAGLRPADVDAVEAHGTGTMLGDPIEAQALLATYGQDRRDGPLRLGSIKSNIAHSQAAAGVAGVMKMVLALRNELLPPTLHVDEPTPHVDWDAGEVELLTEAVEWPAAEGRVRRAGISSFGISGTNAHVIVEEAPVALGASATITDDGRGLAPPGPRGETPVAEASADGGAGDSPAGPWLLSAKSEPALRHQAGRLAAFAARHPDVGAASIARTLADRSRFDRRAVVLGGDRDELLGGLRGLAAGEPLGSLVEGRAIGGATVFVFPGQGTHWDGMAAELLDASPLFAERMHACEVALSPYLDWSVVDLLRRVEGAPEMDRIDVVQPAAFAVAISLAALWESYGVRPAAVVGHSQGEVAAACVAGGLSLEDGARIVALRSRLMARLHDEGTMVSLAESAAEAGARVERFGDAAVVAVVNSPSSVALACSHAAADELLAECERDGVAARAVAATIPSHSAFVEPLRDELLEELGQVSPRRGEIPLWSTVTGAVLDTAELDAAYWYRNLREPVQFESTVRAMARDGYGLFVEPSAHPVATLAVSETLEREIAEGAVAAVGSLRRDEGGFDRFERSLAEAWVAGAKVDWDERPTDAEPVRLPTYAFDRQRFWVASEIGAGDPSAAGQTAAGHPLLAAAVAVAGGDEWLFTGRLSTAGQDWLADHAVFETVLLPGTAFVELALHAGAHAGCGVVEELTLEAPLVFDDGGVAVQVGVGEPDEQGRREVVVHSRRDGDEAAGGDGEPDAAAGWTRHASGTLRPAEPDGDLGADPLWGGAWPPEGAEPADADGVYDRLAAVGMNYGPAFQGLRSAWLRDGEVFAEVELDEAQAKEAGGFGLHPALLDAALHGVFLGDLDGLAGEGVRLPFAWGDVRLHTTAAVSSLRVRLAVVAGALELAAADQQGEPVVSVGRLDVRPADVGALRAAAGADEAASLFAVDWVTAEADDGLAPEDAEVVRLADLFGDGHDDDDVIASVHDALARVLALLQDWIGGDWQDRQRLVLVTERAVDTSGDGDGDGDGPDLIGGAVWGLMRSAQAEHPGRFGLVDLDGSEQSAAALDEALAVADEPQLAIRGGAVLVPRLKRAERAEDGSEPARWNDGTVLITGGTGGLGRLVAHHLVAEHGADDLLLVSRAGAAGAGVAELVEELEQAGARVRVEACDVADRAALSALLDSIPADRPLTGVVHAAGTVDDGTLETLDASRLDTVLAPKADAAWYLHELTRDLGLAHFVMFSSAAGVLGSPGQANYAAANAFLDALAACRREQGLAASSLAWGLWDSDSALTGALDDADLARLARSGVEALSPERGLGLFDAAAAVGEPLLVPIGLDLVALRPAAQMGVLPAMLRGLVRAPRRRRAGGGSLARQLAGLPESEWDQVVLELVRGHVAAVLGHSGAGAVDAGAPFKDLGFDSLAAVELRNRLSQAADVKLPATLVFDYPTPAAVAGYLRSRVEGVGQGGGAATRSRSASDEPIAIVGMAGRFPGGVSSPDDLWDLVAQGRDAIGPLPVNRGWDLDRLYDPNPDVPWTSHVRDGGFVHDADRFDAAFFGIGPREAIAMDPQQRLLLEASWEAIESAGIDPSSLRGSDTGIFAGVMYHDYGAGIGPSSADLEGYIGTGVAGSVASGRVAYTFGLEGPAVTLDTACSSSLVALHLACQALRSGECSLALAGGVTVLTSPGPLTYFSRQRALAPDARCKPFAAAADGTGLSEGVGLLLVERLSDAQRLGHEVLAVVRGSAVNQDGASNGMTAPNGPSQERVIRQALANAGIAATDVDAVEGHGTGTGLGDPIEAQALLATYGQEREAGPLRLGSIKSNLGHTQAAAGVAGVMKMVLALRNELLPESLHVDEPTPHVDWDAGEVELLTEAVEWPANGRTRRAGVSSFGISGTNAHVIVEEYDRGLAPPGPRGETPVTGASADGPADDLAIVPWLVSAKSEAALRGQAQRLHEYAETHEDLDQAAVGRSLAVGRTAFERRAVVLGGDRDELLVGLGELAAGEPSGAVVEGRVAAGRQVAFVFPGQGSQWAGMAVELWDSAPVFAERMGACAAALAPHLDWSLEGVLRGTEGAPALEAVDVVQPALFAVYVSLAALWRHHGVEPSVVVGHSQGEIAAAHVAGMLSLEDAARISAVRGLALAELAGAGGMVSLACSREQAERLLERWEGQIGIAALNGPQSIVVSGPSGALDDLLAACEDDGVRARRIPVDYASHSAEVDAIHDRLIDGLAGIAPQAGDVTLLSTVTGQPVDGATLDADYWFRNLREPVRFEQAIRDLLQDGCGTFVEASPHPVVALAIAETAEDAGATATVVGSLRRDEGGSARFTRSLAEAWAGGVRIDWDRFFAGAGRAALPTYAFDRQRYWLDAVVGVGDVSGAGLLDGGHPLLGAATAVAGGDEWLFSGRLSVGGQEWLADHAVFETVLLPGTGFVELVLHAGRRLGCAAIEDLTLETPLVLDDGQAVAVQLRVGEPDEQGRRAVAIHSRRETADDGGELGADGWVRHASGAVRPDDAELPAADAVWPPAGAEPVEVDGLYDRLAGVGFGYGPAFQGLRAAWHRDAPSGGAGGELFAEVELDAAQRQQADGFGIHPALLDAALHGVFLGGLEGLAGEGVRLPFAWSDVRLHSEGAVSALRVRLTAVDGAIELMAADEQGQPVVSVGALAVRQADVAALQAAAGDRAGDDSLFGVDWVPVDAPSGDDATAAEAVELADLVEGGGDPVATTHATLARVLQLLQRWVGEERPEDRRLVLVTERAVDAGGVAPDLVAGAVWGLLRSAQAEHPGRFALVDLDGSAESRAALPAALGATEEPQLALRGGALLAPRLARVGAAGEGAPTAAPWSGGTVLITGGSGGLGKLVARHLVVEHDAEDLLLVSRAGPEAPGAAELVEELEASGARVRVEACDVSDRAALAALIAAIPDDRPLVGVVHAAGAIDDGTLESLTAERIDRVLAPKADAAWHLHELTRDLGLAHFVLFASAAGVLGSPGQGNYAAANAFLDTLAAQRRAAGLAAASLAWGWWDSDSALTGSLDEADLARLSRSGVEPLSPEHGLALFDAALETGRPLLVPVGLDLAALRPFAQLGVLPPILRGLIRMPRRRGGAASAATLTRRLAGLPEDEWDQVLLELVVGHVAAVLGHPDASAVDAERQLVELGFDSLAAVELRNRLGQATGVRLAPTLVFDHPAPAAIAGHLRGRMAQTVAGGPAAAAPALDGDGPGALTSLLRHARGQDRIVDAAVLLGQASAFCPEFDSLADLPELPPLSELAAGAEAPTLVCLPSFVAGSGPQQFVALARALAGERRVVALTLPGFRKGDPMPATWDVAVDVLAESARRAADGGPVVLVGHSIGGVLAQAVARRLEDDGAAVAGVVMLDTYAPLRADTTRVFGSVLDILLAIDADVSPIHDQNVLAMSAYMRLMAAWEPQSISAPALLVKASEPLEGIAEGADGLSGFESGSTVVEIVGDHFAVVDEAAADVARATEAWLSELPIVEGSQA